jgi:hypothetical protein
MARQAISEYNESNSHKYYYKDKTDSNTDNKIMKPESVVPYNKNLTLVEKSNMLISVAECVGKSHEFLHIDLLCKLPHSLVTESL